MKYFGFIIISISLMSCKSHINNQPEFSALAHKNQIEIKEVNNLRFFGWIKKRRWKNFKRQSHLQKCKSSSVKIKVVRYV